MSLTLRAPLKSATVFLSGTERFTMADEDGKFIFNNITSGTHQLSVTMMGYMPFAQNIIITNQPSYLSVPLKIKPIALAEVTIGGKNKFDANFKLFRRYF
ncbi:carboxypeptidase-like regulatory domain-containing protein [Mucilaginibacter antarcticus]|uniref:carboxypeptidase-like regulatory domain-containing protein n=1 Tax=Mucilaginibacter antarcticus TaxID=1855725 RepID=UPI0036337269